MLKQKLAAFGAMSVVVLSASMVAGQQRSDNDSRIPTKKSETKTATVAAVLNDQQIGDVLKNLGYTADAVKLPGDAVAYKITVPIETGGTKFNIFVAISRSPDGSKVWLGAYFQTPNNGGPIPADVMQKMLEANSRYGPCHFSLNVQAKSLSLALPLDNRNLTGEDLQRQLTIFTTVLRDTETLWNANKWGVLVGGGGR